MLKSDGRSEMIDMLIAGGGYVGLVARRLHQEGGAASLTSWS